MCRTGKKGEVLGTRVGGPELRRKVLAMSCEGPEPGLPEQVLDFESCRCGAQSQPCCSLSIPGKVIHLPDFLISQMGIINPDRPQLP